MGKSDFLQRVEIFDLLLPALVQDCVRESEKAAARPDFIGVRSSRESFARFHFLWNGLAQLIDVHARQIELTDFLLQGHSVHQILHAELDGLLGIQVDGCINSLSVDT